MTDTNKLKMHPKEVPTFKKNKKKDCLQQSKITSNTTIYVNLHYKSSKSFEVLKLFKIKKTSISVNKNNINKPKMA